MANKPLTPRVQGAIDYGFLALNLAGPALLGLPGPVRIVAALLGGVQGSLNALTDQPLAVKRVVPFREHGRIELLSTPAFLLLPALVGALKQARARGFFLAMLALLATVYTLTDWETDPNT